MSPPRSRQQTALLAPIAIALLASAPLATAGLQVSWVSEPVLPGQTALLRVVGAAPLTEASVVEASQAGGPRTRLATRGVTAYGCGVLIPATFKPGPFDVTVDGGVPFTANVARPWFFFGDLGENATAGGWIRLVGEALALDTGDPTDVPSLMINDTSAATPPVVVRARQGPESGGVGAALTRWHAFFDVPRTLPPGQYSLSIASGTDPSQIFRPLCVFLDETRPCVQDIAVGAAGVALADPRTTWASADTFTVSCQQPGPGRNATACVQAAVDAAAGNGGGVVYFPRGQYFVDRPLVVAPGTVIRGEDASLVSIYFKEADETTAPNAYVTSSKPGPWGIEGVTLYVTAFARNIVRFLPGTSGAFMRHTTIRFNSYFCLEAAKGAGSRGRNTHWDHDVGTAVLLAGKNLFVTDNDVFSSGDVVSTLNNGAAGAEFMHIARTTLASPCLPSPPVCLAAAHFLVPCSHTWPRASTTHSRPLCVMSRHRRHLTFAP